MLSEFDRVKLITNFKDIIKEYNNDFDLTFINKAQERYLNNIFETFLNSIEIDYNYVLVDFEFYTKNSIDDSITYLNELKSFDKYLNKIVDEKLSISSLNLKSYYENNKLNLRSLEVLSNINQSLSNLEETIYAFGSSQDIRIADLNNIDYVALKEMNPYEILNINTITKVTDIEKYNNMSKFYYYLSEEEANLILKKRVYEVNKMNLISKITGFYNSLFSDNKVSLFYEIMSIIVAIFYIVFMNEMIHEGNSNILVISTIILLPIGMIFKIRLNKKVKFKKRNHSAVITFASLLVSFSFISMYASNFKSNFAAPETISMIAIFLIALGVAAIELKVNIIDTKFIIGPMMFVYLLYGSIGFSDFILAGIYTGYNFDLLLYSNYAIIFIVYLVLTIVLIIMKNKEDIKYARSRK